MEMIEIRDALIAYGKEILFTDLSFSVKKGGMGCITGESGTGKSSLLNAVMGFVPLSQGQITVDEIRVSPSTIDRVRSRIAWVPQELALPSEWVHEMISIPFELRGNRRQCLPTEKNCLWKDRLMEAFTSLGLETELYDKRVSEISGGQRQRIIIAVASLLGKEIVIADEPTSALDAASVERVVSFFHQLQLKGTTLLTVSHDSRFIAACDTIITLKKKN